MNIYLLFLVDLNRLVCQRINNSLQKSLDLAISRYRMSIRVFFTATYVVDAKVSFGGQYRSCNSGSESSIAQRVRRSSFGIALACCKACPSSNLGSAAQGGFSPMSTSCFFSKKCTMLVDFFISFEKYRGYYLLKHF